MAEERKNEENSAWVKSGYLKWGGVCLSVFLLCFFLVEKPYGEAVAKEAVGALANCFAVPGVMLSGMGGISYIAYLGGYDALSYAFSRFGLHNLFPRGGKGKCDTLYEFRQEKEQRRRRPSFSALAVGLVFLTVGVILSAAYLLI